MFYAEALHVLFIILVKCKKKYTIEITVIIWCYCSKDATPYIFYANQPPQLRKALPFSSSGKIVTYTVVSVCSYVLSFYFF